MDTQKLRQRILDLAIRGKLVPQDPNDEPASVLLDRIRAEKERLIAEGKIKRPKAKKSTDKSHYQQFTQPFDIPESWQWVSLGDIIDEPKYGTSSKSLSVGKMPVLRMGNITKDGKIDYSNLVYSDNESEIIEYQLRKGDILFNRTNSSDWVGKSALYDGELEAIYAGYLVRVRPIMILSEYLILVMTSSYYRNWCHFVKTDAVNQSNINAQKLMSFMLPLPPLKEQKRICDSFFKISMSVKDISDSCNILFDMICLAKSKILDLAMHGKLVPQDPADEPAADLLFRINPKAKIITDNPHYPQLPDNWVMTTIESVCNYGYSETVNVDDIDSSDWVLELEDLEKDSGRIISLKSKTERTINGVRHRFTIGDVLYSKLRTYLNKVLVAPEDGYCTTEIIPVRSYDCVIPEYLCAWLRSPFFLSYTIECCYGVKMPRLSTSDARKGVIPLPPIPEQKRIVQKLNKISTSFEILSNSIG